MRVDITHLHVLLLVNVEKTIYLEDVGSLSEFTTPSSNVCQSAIDVATVATAGDQRVKSMVFDLLDSDGDGLISVEVRLPKWCRVFGFLDINPIYLGSKHATCLDMHDYTLKLVSSQILSCVQHSFY